MSMTQGLTKPISEEEARLWLSEKILDLLGLEGVLDVNLPLDEYGIESRQAMILVGDVEDLLERKLPATIAWDHPTVAALAKYIAAASADPSPPT